MQPIIIQYISETQRIDQTQVKRSKDGTFDYWGDIEGVCNAVILAMGL